jgi:hypothetical protein
MTAPLAQRTRYAVKRSKTLYRDRWKWDSGPEVCRRCYPMVGSCRIALRAGRQDHLENRPALPTRRACRTSTHGLPERVRRTSFTAKERVLSAKAPVSAGRRWRAQRPGRSRRSRRIIDAIQEGGPEAIFHGSANACAGRMTQRRSARYGTLLRTSTPTSTTSPGMYLTGEADRLRRGRLRTFRRHLHLNCSSLHPHPSSTFIEARYKGAEVILIRPTSARLTCCDYHIRSKSGPMPHSSGHVPHRREEGSDQGLFGADRSGSTRPDRRGVSSGAAMAESGRDDQFDSGHAD